MLFEESLLLFEGKQWKKSVAPNEPPFVFHYWIALSNTRMNYVATEKPVAFLQPLTLKLDLEIYKHELV